ncbi:putative uncharacterized protein DDB_G0271606 [Drosophila sulfurigaster albostrigata]|uniref:putative uncharacterized protein DDB_G0271606 n=1 Tax=Drosophila sulfurigaster albostrigata TaxID=89887 RepID=UPI002D21A66A|nr:putative uncharacterized protein DDB_G0271606 [Drosophila sulfurigaster albostrigata]
MDLMQQLTKQLEEQNAKADELENSANFRSVFSINGNPIMPPLMTPERRLEMQKHREAAKQIEGQLCDGDRSANQSKCSTLRMRTGCRQFVDASTNTDSLSDLDSQLRAQPLIIMGRLKQTLQRSEPLIFDNSCNAIMKFVKHTDLKKPQAMQWQLLLEQCLEMKQQTAVIKQQAAEFALSTAEIETQTEAEAAKEIEEVKEEIVEEKKVIQEVVMEAATKDNNKELSSMKTLLNITQRLKQHITHTQRELRRFPTIPLIACKIEKSFSETCSQPRQERLHPQLWKRYHSYPYSESCHPTDCAAPISPSGNMNLPLVPKPDDAPMSNMQIKQRMAAEDQQTLADHKLKSKQKLSSSKSGRPKSVVASSIVHKCAAHASSHANADGMSSTQRRLSYDPRATLKREAALKKAATNQQQQQQSSQGNNNSELTKRKLLDEMEQQQRQRFHQLMSQQAEEQQRMQQEFQSQQQLLMDQMVSDMSTYTYDKLEHPEPDSDCSSITSLPQSRVELDDDVLDK